MSKGALSEERNLVREILKWRNRLLVRVHAEIKSQSLNKPVDDLTEKEEGYERGLQVANRIVIGFMHDKIPETPCEYRSTLRAWCEYSRGVLPEETGIPRMNLIDPYAYPYHEQVR